MATTAKRTELDPRDFLALDALLSDEERAIRDTVRQFVTEQVKPHVGEWFEQGEVPRELIPELAKLGLFGMHLEGYGLPEASSVMYGLTCMELEAGDSGVRSFASVQGSLAMFAIQAVTQIGELDDVIERDGAPVTCHAPVLFLREFCG